MNEHCCSCDKALNRDEIGLSRKLINRGTTRYLCLQCISEKYEVPVDILLQKINEFREMGCTLFSTNE